MKYNLTSNTLMMPDGTYKFKIRIFDKTDDNIFSIQVVADAIKTGILDF